MFHHHMHLPEAQSLQKSNTLHITQPLCFVRQSGHEKPTEAMLDFSPAQAKHAEHMKDLLITKEL